jgi:hypothetical protein
MKLRSAVMVLGLLFLSVAVVSAATAPAASTPPAVSFAAAFGESATCGASSVGSGLTGVVPAPIPLTAECGSCSTSPCAGANMGELCGFSGGQYGYCQSPTGTRCTTGRLMCQCWYGPLP